jgi:hypothetical protein
MLWRLVEFVFVERASCLSERMDHLFRLRTVETAFDSDLPQRAMVEEGVPGSEVAAVVPR